MTMSPELFMAILSMDSYNRGYDEGIAGLGGVGSLVGAAKIVSQSDVSIGSEDRAAGFYAVAYQWDGDTVISYRGTDGGYWGQLKEIVVTDFPIWTGDYDETQLELAAKFYQSVAESVGVSIELTGHSLGGGLAGPSAGSANSLPEPAA